MWMFGGRDADSPVKRMFAGKLLTLQNVILQASAHLPRQKIYELFANNLYALFGTTALAVWDFNFEDRTATLVYEHDLGSVMRESLLRPVPLDLFPEVKLVAESGVAEAVGDVEGSPLLASRVQGEPYHTLGVRAVLVAPLRVRVTVKGIISIYFQQPRVFTPWDKGLALAFANALGLSLNNSEAYEQLASSERAKSEIISIIAHQFRTPVAVLRGNVSLLRDALAGNDAELLNQATGEVEKAGDRLKELIENFLNAQALESGMVAVKMERLELAALVRSAVTALETYRAKHNIQLTLEPPPTELPVQADPRLVGEALQNVIGNAIKYARTSVRLSLRQEHNLSMVVIEDDGVGIPAAEQPMIFQKLFRASNVARHPEASSGLGLYITKKYVENNGGRVWFTSEENRGSTFFVAFPLAGTSGQGMPAGR